jgi:carbonic anhydrase
LTGKVSAPTLSPDLRAFSCVTFPACEGIAVDQILEGVRRFRTVVFPESRELYESLAEKQQPCALFLTCGDSRIEPSLLTGTSPGQIFVERTPGNIVPLYEDTASVGVSASIEYAVAVLGVTDVIVCGHSSCGAMEALLHPEMLEKIPATARWLKYAQPAVQKLEKDYRVEDESARSERLARLNIVEQMSHLRTHPTVEERVKRGSLGIHWWFYEIHTGIVEIFNPATREFEQWP